jgi:hypothetical protein
VAGNGNVSGFWLEVTGGVAEEAEDRVRRTVDLREEKIETMLHNRKNNMTEGRNARRIAKFFDVRK